MLFATEEEAARALDKHREIIGARCAIQSKRYKQTNSEETLNRNQLWLYSIHKLWASCDNASKFSNEGTLSCSEARQQKCSRCSTALWRQSITSPSFRHQPRALCWEIYPRLVLTTWHCKVGQAVLLRFLNVEAAKKIPRLAQTQSHFQVPLLPPSFLQAQQAQIARKDCIRLRGLPYEAQVEHIVDFLGEHAKNIVYQGVHMVHNAQVSSISFLYNTTDTIYTTQYNKAQDPDAVFLHVGNII